MKETPIIFTTELIPKILDETKTQTRRVIKPQPRQSTGKDVNGNEQTFYDWLGKGKDVTRPYSKDPPCVVGCGAWLLKHRIVAYCPYGQVGDRLWVRETHQIIGTMTLRHLSLGKAVKEAGVRYKDGTSLDFACPIDVEADLTRWRPSIHMPRWASRITLEITGIRVERLQSLWEVSEYLAEGLVLDKPIERYYCQRSDCSCSESARGELIEKFKNLWNSLNAKRGYSWESNPWVWVIEFKKVDCSE